jgi:AcrR family transcriptional regulator
MTRKPETPKDQLLRKTMAYVATHGVAELSLRQLADALGTSHRMLVYHFGSKENLVTEVVREVERRERSEVQTHYLDSKLTLDDQIRRLWQRFSDPSLAQQERLFFEVYGQALVGRPEAAKLFEDDIEAWIAPFVRSAKQYGLSRRAARAEARLMIAVIRGLLLDLLATGDKRGADDALEQFLTRRARPSS